MPRALPTASLLSASFFVSCLLWTTSLAGCAASSLRRAPEIPHTVSFNTHAYERLSLKALRGRVVMLFFWAASDITCRKAIAHVDRLRSTYGPKGLVVVGVHSPNWVSFEKPAHYVFENLQACGVVFPVIMDSENRIKAAYGSLMVPSVTLVDRNGFIRAQYGGALDFSAIETTLDQLLTEDGRPAPERLFVPRVEKKPSKPYKDVLL